MGSAVTCRNEFGQFSQLLLAKDSGTSGVGKEELFWRDWILGGVVS